MRFYFDWIVDHRFTDFLAAKRDLFLFPPEEAAVARFREAIQRLLDRIADDEATLAPEPQRQFFLRRMGQEIRPLLDVRLGPDLSTRIAEVEARLVEIQDLARAYNKTV